MSTSESKQSGNRAQQIAGIPCSPVQNRALRAILAVIGFYVAFSRQSPGIERRTIAQFFLLCAAPVLLVGCSLIPFVHKDRPTGVIFVSTDPHLDATMSDESILQELGFDPAWMNASRNQGGDAYTASYTARTGDRVFITRSIATGVFVMQHGPNGNRSWELGKPRATPKRRPIRGGSGHQSYHRLSPDTQPVPLR